MGFSLKKVVPFFFLFLTYSSNAHDEIPQVRGDRKLISNPESITQFAGKAEEKTEQVIGGRDRVKPAVSGSAEATGVNPRRYEENPAVADHSRPWAHKTPCEVLKERTALAVKNIGEATAAKLFGNNGRRVFLAVWKSGKIYLKMEKKCEEFLNVFNCATSPCLLPDCVIQVVEATGVASCPADTCVLPAPFNCPFPDTFAIGTSNYEMP